MSYKFSVLLSLCCLLAAGVVARGQAIGPFNSISRQDVQLLLADTAKTNPAVLKKMAKDPEMRRQQIENLKQLFAFASQAVKDGMSSDPTNRQELDNIRAEIVAVNYDKEINKGKAALPPFGYLGADRVEKYWDEMGHEPEFQKFLDAKLKVLRAGNPKMTNREIPEEEKTQARDIFAKIRIYRAEYELKVKKGTMSKKFIDKAGLQVKLQQAQFLARLYSEKIADQTKVTDDEMAAYFAARPDLDPARKRAAAQGILDRAKAGEDFAGLANEFSQDPGNTDVDGNFQGGLYKDVPKGRMVAPFEAAAIALQPGQISPELVETEFGFHVLKLERIGTAADANGQASLIYDVRHILISTGVNEPDKPGARQVAIKDYVRNKLEAKKEKKMIDDIVAANNVQVPGDFTVPKPGPIPLRRKIMKKRPAIQSPPVIQSPDEAASPEEPRIGMSALEARQSSWGSPLEVKTTETARGTFERWIYWGNRYLYFTNGRLTTISR